MTYRPLSSCWKRQRKVEAATVIHSRVRDRYAYAYSGARSPLIPCGAVPLWHDLRRHQHRACERCFGQEVSDQFYHRRWEPAPANREGSHRRFTSEAAEARNRRDDGQGLGSGNARETRTIPLASGISATQAARTALPPMPAVVNAHALNA